MVYYEKGIVVKTAAPAVLMPLPKISHVSQFVRHRNYFIDVFKWRTFSPVKFSRAQIAVQLCYCVTDCSTKLETSHC
jgi:hypothetical protein